jgi:hypothetical protein
MAVAASLMGLAVALCQGPQLAYAGDPEADLAIPQVAHLTGVGGSEWRSDVTVHADADMTVEACYVARKGTQGRRSCFTFSLSADEERTYEDILWNDDALDLDDPEGQGLEQASGGLAFTVLEGDASTFRAQSIVYAIENEGTPEETTYGMFFKGVTPDEAYGAGDTAYTLGSADATRYRENVGLYSFVDGTAVTLRAFKGGSQVGNDLSLELDTDKSQQLNNIFKRLGTAPQAGLLLEWEFTGGMGVPYHNVIDGVGSPDYGSSDPTNVPALSGATELVLAGVGRVHGIAEWGNDVVIGNPGNEPAAVTVELYLRDDFHSRFQTGPGVFRTEEVTISARDTVVFSNVFDDLFGITDDVVGAFRIVSDGEVVAYARSKSVVRDPSAKANGQIVGTLGQSVPGLTVRQQIEAFRTHHFLGTRTATDERPNIRTNLLIFDSSDRGTTCDLEACMDEQCAEKAYSIEGGSMSQWTSLLQRLGLPSTPGHAHITIRCDRPGVFTFVSSVMDSDDPSTLPPWRGVLDHPLPIANLYVHTWLPPRDGEFYLSNNEIVRMIWGGYGLPGYARDIAEIYSYHSDTTTHVNLLERWLEDLHGDWEDDDVLDAESDPFHWSWPEGRVRFYLEPGGTESVDWAMDENGMRLLYNLVAGIYGEGNSTDGFLRNYVTVLPFVYGGRMGGQPDLRHDPTWDTRDPNEVRYLRSAPAYVTRYFPSSDSHFFLANHEIRAMINGDFGTESYADELAEIIYPEHSETFSSVDEVESWLLSQANYLVAGEPEMTGEFEPFLWDNDHTVGNPSLVFYQEQPPESVGRLDLGPEAMQAVYTLVRNDFLVRYVEANQGFYDDDITDEYGLSGAAWDQQGPYATNRGVVPPVRYVTGWFPAIDEQFFLANHEVRAMINGTADTRPFAREMAEIIFDHSETPLNMDAVEQTLYHLTDGSTDNREFDGTIDPFQYSYAAGITLYEASDETDTPDWVMDEVGMRTLWVLVRDQFLFRYVNANRELYGRGRPKLDVDYLKNRWDTQDPNP